MILGAGAVVQTINANIEKVITDSGNKIVLAKINTDENQQIAAQLRIQSIPTVCV